MFDFGSANAEQRQAIITTEGPVLTIAGPGTGKTFTLVKRIAYLVVEKNVNPNEIMVVTFTEKAAKELLTRISNEFIKYDININMNEMYVGTFHSVCLRLLKEYSEYADSQKKSRMLDAFEQAYLVCRNIENFKHLSGFAKHIPASQGVWKQALEICRYVNQMMEELVDVETMENDRDEDIRLLAKLVTRYKELLERSCAMDFSSIQTEIYKLFAEHPDALKSVQDKVRYIMVDEYQDTNYIQETLVFMIAGERKNICVVGDDDQGMYRFRGATIRNILEFPNKFNIGECNIVHLNKNYRSEPEIISFYNNWMENVEGINLFNWDKYRYDKQIVAAKEKLRIDSSVYSCGGESLDIEKEDLLYLVKKLKKNGNISDYNQIAFLFSSVKSEEATTIGAYLEANGIPVYSPRSDMFFEREEVKQVLGCLIVCFPFYLQDLKKNTFLNRISDELQRYYIDCVKEAVSLMKSDQELHDYIDGQMKYVAGLQEDTEQGLLDVLYRLLSYEPFKTHLEADLNDNVFKSRAARNLSEISRIIKKYCFLHNMHGLTVSNKIAMPEELFNIYIKYLYIDGIGEYEDESEYAPSGCVSFMTIHQSKGLEFPVVVVGSLGNTPRRNSDPLLYSAENRFFHRKPFEPMADIKFFDFWRLYYVAFSRAQNMLVLATKKGDCKYFAPYLDRLPNVSEFDSDLKFETVKDVNFKHVYSFTSHISIYDGCPTQYKFYKEYGFAQNQMFHTSIGSLVHATLEDMNKCIISGNLSRVSETSIREWFCMNYQIMQEQTGYFLTEEQQESALQQVLRYFYHRKDELGRVWKAEEEINLVLPEYILQGIIDLVEGDEETVEIVDYKTGPKPDIEGHPERVEHYKKQLEIYAYLIEKRYGKKVSRMHLYYTSTLEGNPIISFDWSRDAIDKTVEEITDTVHAIENKIFENKVQNTYACRFCDMKYVCNKAVG
ncbi:MAG: ATP-dependent helicase [Lachnospiraceae bacterium]|nr:ATP-dependent helicase [Lachnospiraceae bacterium]